MRIVDLRATTVAVPIEAPLLHSNGAHWGRFVRTIVEVEADNGLVGLGEMGGGGQSAEAVFRGVRDCLVGHDVFQLEALRFKIANPTASLYNDRTQILAAIEFACLDLIGQHLGVPVYDLLGGKLRESVPFASYLFFRLPGPGGVPGEVRTPDQLVSYAKELKSAFGFTVHKLKGGVFPPDYELECYRALAAAMPGDRLRYDPNAVLNLGDAIRFGHAITGLNNDYFEDPVLGLEDLRRVREQVGVPLATNTVVVNFEQLAANVLHLGAVLPNLTHAADAHYHHLRDDVIVGGKMRYVGGQIAVPTGPGLGVTLDSERVTRYAELYRELGGYPYDRDPGRPGWYPLVPNDRWADPARELRPI